MEGYIVQSSSYRTTYDRLAATVTMRVPSARFEETLAQLRALDGKVQSETLSGEDVTDQYVDLQSRLKALQATETELLALLAEVRQSEGNAQEKAQAILDIYTQLTNVRTQIEQYQGQMNYLSQMAAMATITVDLQPREPEITQPVVEEGYNPGSTLSRAARSLIQVLQWLLNALIWFVVVLLPVLLIIAAPIVLVMWLVRRGKRSKKAAAERSVTKGPDERL
jgi:predicted ribosome quality control (RQC) complex YloA/Tae2 family protein